MIELGSEIKDRVSDVKGIAIARIEYLNGCVRYGIQQKVKKDGTLPETVYVDVEQVEIIKKKVAKKNHTGGPSDYEPDRTYGKR